MPRPLRVLPHLTWLLAAAVLMLAGCQRSADEAPAPGSDSPTAAARLLVDDLRHDDLAAFWKHGLPPADHAALVERWRQAQAAQTTTDAARQGYRQFMGSLTQPGAKAALARRLQEKVTRIADRYGDQVPVLVAIGGAVLTRIVVADVALRPTAAQQQGLHDALAPVLQWAQQAPWLDRERAGRSANVAIDTARSLQLATLDQARALDFPGAMTKTSRLWAGAKQALALYGLSLDAVLDSARVTLVSQQADVAHVRIDYLLKGQPQQVVLKMRAVDGRWYPDALPQLARAVAPPDWDGWWGPSRAHVRYITTGQGMDPSPVH
jgi:hypothetical protein